MTVKKALPIREKELQTLLATPEGRMELQLLASKYDASSDRPRPAHTSVVTYILVHEREKGMIDS